MLSEGQDTARQPAGGARTGSERNRVYRSTREIKYGDCARLITSIILIGMPGAGKSTAGVILAKTMGMQFVDTDIVIQQKCGRLLQEIIDAEGPESFLATEEKTVLALEERNAVIATGGSVVFSRRAMEHLKSDGVVVYLRISFEEMEKRLMNITMRGIVLHAGQGLRDMYNERVPLYEQYADITIGCADEDFERVVSTIVDELKKYRPGHRPGR